MDNQNMNIQRTTIQKSLMMKGQDIKGDDIAILTKPYFLEYAEFNILCDTNRGCKEWSKRFLLTGIGTTITIIGKVCAFVYDFQKIENKNDVKLKLEDWEWISILIAFGLSLVLFGLSFWIKDQKDTLITKIRIFFNTND